MPETFTPNNSGERPVSADPHQQPIPSDPNAPSGAAANDAYVARGGGDFERVLLRAICDLPAFAAQVMPVLDPELFDGDESNAIYTWIAEDYQRHQTVPEFAILRVRNRNENRNTKLEDHIDAAIRALATMPPFHENQVPILLADTEKWIQRRKRHAALIRIVSADAEDHDVRPLIQRLSDAYDWRFGNGVTGRYAFKDRDALLKSATAPFLVQNLIVQKSLVALVAPPNGNKTFLAVDLALSIASGQQTWLGKPLYQSGPVVYVLAEGDGRFKLRVQAWEQEHGIEHDYPFYTVNEAVALTNADAADAFVREVAAIKPVLIVLDTWSRCLAGANENDQQDTSAAVGVCDRLRQQHGCAVLILHHPTKDGSAERGSSVLRGAVDTMVLLKVPDPSKPEFTLLCDKQKDAEYFAPIYLRRDRVTLASERDPYTGDPLESCVVRVVPATTAMQEADQRLWRAQQFLRQNPNATRNDVATHLRGNRQTTLREIGEWVERGELWFRAHKSDPMASLKADVSETIQ